MNRQNPIRRFDINAPCPRFIVIAMASPRDEYLTDTSETELKSITLPLEKTSQISLSIRQPVISRSDRSVNVKFLNEWAHAERAKN